MISEEPDVHASRDYENATEMMELFYLLITIGILIIVIYTHH